jgi:hypothetical protein
MKKGLQHKIILNESNVILCYGEINTKLFKKFSANHHKIPTYGMPPPRFRPQRYQNIINKNKKF